MTLIVTGAAGWFGRAFLDLLAHEGAGDVRVVVRRPADVPAVASALPHAQVHVADLTDPGAVADLFAGVQESQVVHAAGVIHPGSIDEFERVNVAATRNVLEAALAAGVQRVVHLSSNSAIGVNPTKDEVFRDQEPYDPYLGYGRSKMQGEHVVTDVLGRAGIPGVILRPPWFYGRFQPHRQAKFLKTVRSGRFPLIGDGSNLRSMVDVDRLARAAWLALHADTQGVRPYWIADERPYAMTEILAAVQQAARLEDLSVRPGHVRLPALAASVARSIDATLQKRGRYQQELHVAGELDLTIACSVAGAVRDLGFEPATDVVDGMRRSYRWGLTHGQDV